MLSSTLTQNHKTQLDMKGQIERTKFFLLNLINLLSSYDQTIKVLRKYLFFINLAFLVLI